MVKFYAAVAGFRLSIVNGTDKAHVASTNALWAPLVNTPPHVPPIPHHITAKAVCEGRCRDFWAYPHECPESLLEHTIPTIRHDLQLLCRGILATEAAMGRPVELDDVAIHLRVGDMFKPELKDMGLYPWWHIANTIQGSSPKTIGIVTIAGQQGGIRKEDSPYVQRGTRVLEDLVDFLKEQFPASKVIVRNDKTEGPQIALSRLVLARAHTICAGVSTFCLWPALGSVGMGHITLAELFSWVAKIDDPNVKVHKVPFLSGFETNRRGLDTDGVLAWLRSRIGMADSNSSRVSLR